MNSTTGKSIEAGFYSIIDYTVDGPETQRELVEAFAEIQERWVRFYPGYRSARFHASIDGTRVYNIVHWASEADYRNFEKKSDTEGRMAAIQDALAGLSGRAEPRMSGDPRYTVVREVGPGPQRTNSAIRSPDYVRSAEALIKSERKPMKVEIYADVLCPWCFIGKRRIADALAQVDDRDRLEVVWRSYELGPDEGKVPGLTAAETIAEMWGDQASARVARIQTLGAAEGLELDLHRARPVNTFDAHRLSHLAADRDRADEMMERLLRAYHTEGLNIADPRVLERLGVEAGLDAGEVRDLLADDAYAEDVRADERRAAEQGVTGVPSVVIDGRPPVSGVQSPTELHRLLDHASGESHAVQRHV